MFKAKKRHPNRQKVSKIGTANDPVYKITYVDERGETKYDLQSCSQGVDMYIQGIHYDNKDFINQLKHI